MLIENKIEVMHILSISQNARLLWLLKLGYCDLGYIGEAFVRKEEHRVGRYPERFSKIQNCVSDHNK